MHEIRPCRSGKSEPLGEHRQQNAPILLELHQQEQADKKYIPLSASCARIRKDWWVPQANRVALCERHFQYRHTQEQDGGEAQAQNQDVQLAAPWPLASKPCPAPL